jgi:CBS domain containing-hemolysin-like protein
MIMFLLALFLALMALAAIVLEKTYFYLPLKELKRQAAHHEEPAVTLFRAAVYGTDLKVLLWIVIGLCAAGCFVLFEHVAPDVLSIAAILLIVWFGFLWLPRTRLTALGVQLAVWCTPILAELLRWWHPIGRYVSQFASRHRTAGHTGLYEKEDLFDLLDRQRHQTDNRISDDEIGRMRSVLQFTEYRVGDITIPRKQVKAVAVDEAISPVLVDELHQSGHVRFPVYDGKVSHIVGTLPLEVVADIKHKGVVRDYYDEHLAYVHESDSLEQALRAFYETRQHLFIVINSADQYVGIITLSDVLQYLFGATEKEQFVRSYDRKAVLERHQHTPTPAESMHRPEKTTE